ncbi:hypothetical protein E2C01_061957 [Portunus trituberculatus]|uniref:Uncharacterized protein n=1 Tax=Portunus trituberculatus TaxID=210409 RepID=A0A5B7HCC9_PORTR|nr:hypothetical protein [Portunus trituberculatus]
MRFYLGSQMAGEALAARRGEGRRRGQGYRDTPLAALHTECRLCLRVLLRPINCTTAFPEFAAAAAATLSRRGSALLPLLEAAGDKDAAPGGLCREVLSASLRAGAWKWSQRSLGSQKSGVN